MDSSFTRLLNVNIEYSAGSRVGRKGYTLIQKKFESRTSTFYIVYHSGVRIYLTRSLDRHSPLIAHSTRSPSFGPEFVAIQASNGTFRMENEHFWTAGIMPDAATALLLNLYPDSAPCSDVARL